MPYIVLTDDAPLMEVKELCEQFKYIIKTTVLNEKRSPMREESIIDRLDNQELWIGEVSNKLRQLEQKIDVVKDIAIGKI